MKNVKKKIKKALFGKTKISSLSKNGVDYI